MHNAPKAPKCNGCKHLRYRPSHLEKPDHIIPAWSAPGEYLCAIFGTIGPASHVPMPRTPTCKQN